MSNIMITAQLPLRSLAIVLVAVLGLTGTAGYLYLLKKPLLTLSGTQDEFFNLRRARPPDEPVEARIATVEAELETLRAKLQGAGPKLAANEMVAFVIGRLDKLARRQRVQLVSVEPGNIAKVFEFDEIPFHVEVIGGYFRLVDWLHDAERELGPMVIKSFDIAPAPGEDSRRMRLTMVSYRHNGGGA